jgi:hypothetical protein
MLNPEYVDVNKGNPDLINIGFTSDGYNVIEISIRKKDAPQLAKMLMEI